MEGCEEVWLTEAWSPRASEERDEPGDDQRDGAVARKYLSLSRWAMLSCSLVVSDLERSLVARPMAQWAKRASRRGEGGIERRGVSGAA